MSNLLDKASIILTPTASNNGEALCVKPSDGSGDFDFSRNSAATRVNAQGLVENVQILSSNLVQNGDFSEEGVQEVSNGSFSQEGSELITNGNFDTDSDWGLGANWNISNGKANAVSALSLERLQQFNLGQSINRPYKVTFSVSNLTQGSFKVWFGSVQSQTITSDGDYTIYLTPTTTEQIFIYTIGTTTGSIDNFSVREVGQDWTLNTGWSIGEDKAVCNGTTANLIQSNVGTANKNFKLVFTISDYISGVVRPAFVGLNAESPDFSGNGTYTTYISSLTDLRFVFYSTSFNGSITNISVKEVGQNWLLDANWSIAEDKAVSDGTNGFIRTSTNVFESGKTYKVGITVSNITTGQVSYPYDGAATSYISANGIYETIYTPNTTNVCYVYGRNGFDGSITNISVIEITDDTNLPRINYEGFSYQDALGSELVTNGDFATDSDWSKQNGATISNGSANFSVSNSKISQSIYSPTINKVYRVELNSNKINSSNTAVIIYGNGFYGLSDIPSVGKNILYITTNISGGSQINTFQISGGANGSIDNVSVKEYLGQEVVPDSGCGSWLFEPQSTNRITQSELFSDSVWIKLGASVSNGFTSPDGTDNAYKIIEDTSNGTHRIANTELDFVNGETYTFSCFAKKGERDFLHIRASSTATFGINSYFDLANGVVGTTTFGTASIQDYGNGWYRCSIVGISSNTGGTAISIYSAIADGSNFYQGDGTSGVYTYGAQFEQQSYVTSYIPTSGSTVTRNQDVCTNGGSLASINSTEGVLYAEIAALADDLSFRNICINDASTNNRVVIRYKNASNAVNFFLRSNNATIINTDISISNIKDFKKVAFKYKSGDIKGYINGTQVFSDTDTFTFSSPLLELDFNDGGTGGNFFGKTKALAVWKEALSDAELTELTTI